MIRVVAIIALLAVLLVPALVDAQSSRSNFHIQRFAVPGNAHPNTTGYLVHSDMQSVNLSLGGGVRLGTDGVYFADLIRMQQNGVMVYCRDCSIAAACAANGTGAIAKRIAGSWVCN